MAIVKRGRSWSLAIRPFGGKQVWIKLEGATTKAVAHAIERQLKVALDARDYRALDPAARAACVGIFVNQGWELPSDLAPDRARPAETLTLWKAIELCRDYPGFTTAKNRERTRQCLKNLLHFFGEDKPVKELWVPQIREYQLARSTEGAAAATVNREKSTLSRVFQVLVEMRHVETNPARLVAPLSEKAAKRHSYISWADFQRVLTVLPDWYRPIAQTAYYTGMRRGEVVGMLWKRTDLKKRIITLAPKEVKEGWWKRVPIHRDLLPILEARRADRLVGLDHVFHRDGRDLDDAKRIRWCWKRGIAGLGFNPPPRFHDLRHTWKSNARRSGVHPEIERAIMGHSSAGKGIHEGYGLISDEELLVAIDRMTFNHGETQIMVAGAVG
ncbi:MAG: tyrosine-type recombinase/integrase [Pseudomonadota bacterium]